jgi:hypothetical protein
LRPHWPESTGWSKWLRLAGIPELTAKAGLQFDHSDHCLDAAIQGSGIVLGRRAMASRDIEQGRLVVPFDLDLPFQGGIYSVTTEAKASNPDVQAFRNWLREEARSDPHGGAACATVIELPWAWSGTPGFLSRDRANRIAFPKNMRTGRSRMTKNPTFDRAADDIGNIVHLEHVNVCVPDQGLATTFYISALGLTRDPYMMTGVDNMWANIGRSQFHLPTRGTHVLRGYTGLVMPWFDTLASRLVAARTLLADTRFDFDVHNSFIDIICPWGNRIRCHPPGPVFGGMTVGMPYVVLDVPAGTAPAIAEFYAEILGARSATTEFGDANAAKVTVGNDQNLYFRETDAPVPSFDGHHIQIYISDFSGPHNRMLELDLITEESDAHQYRFEDILDLKTGEKVFALEHEVRSLRHPLYARPLINRNPAQMITTYVPGQDALYPDR